MEPFFPFPGDFHGLFHPFFPGHYAPGAFQCILYADLPYRVPDLRPEASLLYPGCSKRGRACLDLGLFKDENAFRNLIITEHFIFCNCDHFHDPSPDPVNVGQCQDNHGIHYHIPSGRPYLFHGHWSH